MLPRFTFRVPACDKGLDMLSAYHTKRETSAGNALDIPVHDTSSHYADGLRTLAEADYQKMLSARGFGQGVKVVTGFRGDAQPVRGTLDILDKWFGLRPECRRGVTVTGTRPLLEALCYTQAVPAVRLLG
jgi:hypothetical protein